MNKLNVGDYVRTRHRGFQPPQIAKIKSMKRDAGYNNQYYIELDHNLLPDYECYIYEEDIVKSANPNKRHGIIDLIEVGDYVNGYQVIEKPYIYHNIQFVSVDTQDSWSWGKGEMPIENIKSIVTKEQFENISYKVGE